MVEKRLVYVFDCGVICSPGIGCEPVLFSEEVLEQSQVGSVERSVHHSLEANVFVKPDGPTQGVLEGGIDCQYIEV